MGLFGLFGNKNKSSNPASAPDIADLPPIPEPDSSLDLPPSNDLSSTDLPDIPTEDSSNMNLPDENLSLDNSSSTDLSEISPDHPLPDLSPSDLDPTLSETPALAPLEETPKESPLVSEEPVKSMTPTQEVPTSLLENPVVSASESKPSLPVFEEVTVPNQIDVESLTISELFIKREQYGQVLETLYNTQKELDALVKKSVVAKPNEKIGMLLKKSTAKHTDLNKGLMFVEEHLIE